MTKTSKTISSLLVLVILGACKTGTPKDPLLQLSSAESLTQGKSLLEKKKYTQARRYFTHAFEAEPNSASGREALLLSADTLYLEGGNQNLIQAEAKYRDFQNRFPTSERSPYVQFQVGKALSGRMERPDRDQSVSEKALDAFKDLVRLYPTSEYAAQSQEEIRRVRQNLAEHEFVVGLFYLRYGLPPAASARFQHLLDTYPDYEQRDKALFNLGLAYQKGRQADKSAAAWKQLREEFPNSPYLAKLNEKPNEKPIKKKG